MFKKKSVLYTWILSYLVVLLMVVLMCALLGHNAQKQLIREYKSVTQTLQKQANSSIDQFVQKLEECAYGLGNDYLVTMFLANSAPTSATYYNLTPIQQTLGVYMIQSDGTVKRYLYMDNIQQALTDSAIYRTAELDRILQFDTSKQSAECLSTYHYNELVTYAPDEGPARILMITSYPLMSQNPKGGLVQDINPNVLTEMLSSHAAVNSGTTVLRDKDGLILCRVGDQETAAALGEADLSKIKDSEITLDGERYWIQNELLRPCEWELVTVVPMSVIRSNSGRIIRNSIPIILLVMIGMAALCTVFVYLQYKPLRHLQNSMVDEKLELPGGNEYDQLEAAFRDVRTSREQIMRLSAQQNSRLQQEFMRSCVQGNVVCHEKTLDQMLEHLDIRFNGTWFVLLVLDAGGVDSTLWQDVWDSNIQRENEKERIWSILLPREDQWMVVLNANDRQKICNAADRVEAVFREELYKSGVDLLCTKSNPWEDFKNIHLAYLEATEAWRYHTDRMEGEYDASDAAGNRLPAPKLSNEQEELLMRYILAGNIPEAQSTLELIIKHNWVEQLIPVSMCRCLAYSLLFDILRLFSQKSGLWDIQGEALRMDLHTLRRQNTREEIEQLLKDVVERSAAACQGYNEQPADRNLQMQRIIQCVNEHYRETDFNVSRAAELLDMRVTYLSNLFKKQMGIGLLNYISALRVKYAKQCILEQNMSVAQAAREAGFENINTFIRTFKKYEGTTPGRIGN